LLTPHGPVALGHGSSGVSVSASIHAFRSRCPARVTATSGRLLYAQHRSGMETTPLRCDATYPAGSA
jgi:hypothetical protein